MTTIKYVKVSQIKSGFTYLPTEMTAKSQLAILEKSNEPVIDVFEDGDKQYLLWKGIDNYNSLKKLDTMKEVACSIHKTSISTYHWMIQLLQSAYNENAYSYIKKELINQLVEVDNIPLKKVVNDSGISEDKLQIHLADLSIPTYYRELSQTYGNQNLLNTLFKLDVDISFKYVLADEIFKGKKITLEMLKLFSRYLKSYSFDPTKQNAVSLFREITDRERALNFYWDKLNTNMQQMSPSNIIIFSPCNI
ncbi:hypothetical protein BpOF4_06360 [Alkalihalophilus pseudofirmus OF4]|uniref:Uncharacterized protein n=1 Tax=Alkalihalophilus pseudofirmus (strain ATCC BAA-2126 / JCM 17055 / OF4) TaxID=398511 RepID=D3G057_ALKPO|nr:hypothetical protein [Alkalihalophilus pseudofirmus]ADC49332.1 hypothetical protein BpOF4_06360 [Alkalihalophilus pseudofirmus OF4]